MTREPETLSEADEIAALLPWYVTGKISADERARVDAYMSAHPEARRQLAVAREEADAVFAADAGLEVPHRALDKLRASLGASPAVRIASAKASFMDRLSEFFAGFAAHLSPRQLALASVTGALVLGMLAGYVGRGPGGSEFTVATNEPAAAKGTYALVALAPAAPASALSAFLAENGFAIVDGPRTGGVYRVRVSAQVLGDAAAEAARGKLKTRTDLFTFVSAAPAGN